MKKLVQISLVSILILGISCNSEINSPLGTFDAVVTGTVTESNGNPVNDVIILVEFNFSGCGDSSFISDGVAESDVEGRFERRIFHPTQEKIKCIKLTATPSQGSGLQEVIVTQNLNLQLKPSASIDSVNIEVQL